MCVHKRPAREHSLVAYDSSTYYQPYTEWIPVTGMDTARVAFMLRARTGNFECSPAYQLAEVLTDKPDDWTQTGSFRNTESSFTADIDLTSVNGSHFFIRFGIAYKSTSGSGGADVRLTLTYNSTGRVLGKKTLSLHVDTTLDQFQPVTRWVPALDMAKAKARVVLTDGTTNQFKYGLAIRTATSDPDDPDGAWADVGTTLQTITTTNEQRLISDQTITTSGKTWMQLGVVYEKVSTQAQATLFIEIASRE